MFYKKWKRTKHKRKKKKKIYILKRDFIINIDAL